jgi:transcriptional antiterminator NusG
MNDDINTTPDDNPTDATPPADANAPSPQEEAAIEQPVDAEPEPEAATPAENETLTAEGDEHRGADEAAIAPLSSEGEASAIAAAEPAPDSKRKWYVVKVASGREESIKAALERKIKIEGLEEFLGQIVIPVERVTEVKKVRETKNGEKVTKEKRVIKEKKKFPGYLMVEVEFNDQILYVFRETAGVGDFVGAAPGKPPVPMSDRDVQAMLGSMLPEEAKGKVGARKPMKVKIDLEKGDKVRIRDGAFAGMEGEVKDIAEPKDEMETPKIAVEVSIFGRPVKIDNLEYWQIDKV